MEVNPGIGLHLGNGKHNWDGWINVDILDSADISCDLRRLELKSDYADIAVAIHVIEHFYEWEAKPLLEEWRRVLKPGGQLVLELPCMNKVLAYITNSVNKNKPLAMGFSWYVFWGDPAYKDEFMTHKWGYTEEMIIKLLTDAGFRYAEIEEPRYHFKDRDMRVTAIK